MSRTVRLYQIENLIRLRGGASFRTLQERLEVSPATLKRDIAFLRDQLGAPIEYDRFDNVYRFGGEFRSEKHELPGLWFNEHELRALLLSHQMLAEIDHDGVLARHLQPLVDRIHGMLGENEAEAKALLKRVRILGQASRPVPSQWFELVGEALVKRKRIRLRYLTRSRAEAGEREVSPQRLVHYRHTWYLDAWCHQRERLLRFALDAVEHAERLATRTKDVPMRDLEAEMDGGYGIYAGPARHTARLRFEADAARWVRHEVWHPAQVLRELPDGRLEMDLPYGDDTELVMDLLRHGPSVEVLGPAGLRQAVRERLQEALARYA